MATTYVWPPINATISATGLATSANQVLQITQETTTATETTAINGKIPALGQALMTGSAPVVIASNQSAVPVSGPLTDAQLRATAVPVSLSSTTITGTVAATQSGTWNITNVSGTVSLPTGAATESTLSTLNGKVTACNTGAVVISGALPAGSNVIGHVIVDSGSITTGGLTDTQLRATPVPVSLTSTTITGTVAATQSGTWTVQPGNTANTTAWLVKELVSTTSTITSVASSASSVSLLASNSSRLGAMFYNDSTQICFLKFGTTASSTSYTVQLGPNGYYEIPTAHIYTGAIDAIWASANGNMRITELS